MSETEEFIERWANGYSDRRIEKIRRRLEEAKKSKVVNLDYIRHYEAELKLRGVRIK